MNYIHQKYFSGFTKTNELGERSNQYIPKSNPFQQNEDRQHYSVGTLFKHINRKYKIENYCGENVVIMISNGYVGITPFLRNSDLSIEDWKQTTDFIELSEDIRTFYKLSKNANLIIQINDSQPGFGNNNITINNDTNIDETLCTNIHNFNGYYVHPILFPCFLLWRYRHFRFINSAILMSAIKIKQQVINTIVTDPSLIGLMDNNNIVYDNEIHNKRLFKEDHIPFGNYFASMFENTPLANINNEIVKNIYNIYSNNTKLNKVCDKNNSLNNGLSTMDAVTNSISIKKNPNKEFPFELNRNPNAPKPKKKSSMKGSIIIYRKQQNISETSIINNDNSNINYNYENNQTNNNTTLIPLNQNNAEIIYTIFCSNETNTTWRCNKLSLSKENTLLKIFCDGQNSNHKELTGIIKRTIENIITTKNGGNSFVLKPHINEYDFVRTVSICVNQNGGRIVETILSEFENNSLMQQFSQKSMFQQPILHYPMQYIQPQLVPIQFQSQQQTSQQQNPQLNSNNIQQNQLNIL